jgi:putative membrane protein
VSKVGLLVAGVAVFAAAQLPPLHEAASELFSAHMIQHLLLVLVAAPLLALGLPRVATGPAIVVWVLHTGAMWAWHLPTAYDAALRTNALHGLEHLSFLVTGVLFWAFVLRRVDVSPLQRVGLTFATALQSGALGALLAFATRPLYRSHLVSAERWDLTALQDQQLAGALMWVPPGVVYLAVMLVLLYRWFTRIDGVPRPARGGAR